MIEWYYFAIASGVLTALTTLIEKHLLKKEHATSFTAITTIVTAIISLVFSPYANFNLTLLQLVYIYIASTAFVGSTLLVARLYRHEDVSSITPITSTLPILFLTVLAFIFINEKLSTTQYIGIIILVISIYLMLKDAKKAIPIKFVKKNVQYFVLAGLLYATGATILKYTLYSISPFTFIVLSGIFMSIDVLIFVFIRFETYKYMLKKMQNYKVETIIYSLAATSYGILYYLAAATEPVSIVYPLRSGVSIVMAVFASSIILKEKIARRIPIAIIMIVAMYLLIG